MLSRIFAKDFRMTAKMIEIKPIRSTDARNIIRKLHYSGKVVQGSQIHFGVFLHGICGGALQFGPSLDKRKVLGLVYDTPWNGFIELNRMACADWLPRNTPSRALSVSLKILKKTYPFLQWVLSYADATQCGDGTIYRASGFVLTSIKKNTEIYAHASGDITASSTHSSGPSVLKNKGKAGASFLTRRGYVLLKGFQLRYIYFLHPGARQRLTVPILPFSDIDKHGARMAKGQRPASIESDASADQAEQGGASPTAGLELADMTGKTPVLCTSTAINAT